MPPDADDESFRKALCKNEGPFGDAEAKGLFSFVLSSSLSFGEYAAPKGLCVSIFETGEVAFGFCCAFIFDCDGGVEPEENLELRLDIHEFLLPVTGLGAVFGVAGDVPVGFPSTDLSSFLTSFVAFAPSSCNDPLDTVGVTGAGAEEVLSVVLVFSRLRSWAIVASESATDLSLTTDDADLQRDRWSCGRVRRGYAQLSDVRLTFLRVMQPADIHSLNPFHLESVCDLITVC